MMRAEKAARNEEIKALRSQGVSCVEIARAYNISPQRVSQIMYKGKTTPRLESKQDREERNEKMLEMRIAGAKPPEIAGRFGVCEGTVWHGVKEAQKRVFDEWKTGVRASTCRNVAEPEDGYDAPFACSECGVSVPVGMYHVEKTTPVPDEIADAIGVPRGSEIHSNDFLAFKFCPCCGARVVD